MIDLKVTDPSVRDFQACNQAVEVCQESCAFLQCLSSLAVNLLQGLEILPSSSKRQSRPEHSWRRYPAQTLAAPATPAPSKTIWKSSQKLRLLSLFSRQPLVICERGTPAEAPSCLTSSKKPFPYLSLQQKNQAWVKERSREQTLERDRRGEGK